MGVTLSEVQLAEAVLGGITREPLGISNPSACLLAPGHWLASVDGQEQSTFHDGDEV
jgi:hypothetical protein